ncbi:MAG: ATP-binding protein [Eubacterium sp.]|nr:ATP-binding protein [Eubacterium sp.]
MTKKIFRAFSIVAVLVAALSFALIMGLLYRYFTNVLQKDLKDQTLLAAEGVESEGLDYLKNLKLDSARITWIDREGNILYDTDMDASKMENHLQREEIKEAIANGTGESVRYSKTLMRRSLYSARLLDDGTIIRISEPQSTVISLMLGMIQPIAVIILLILGASIYFAYRLSEQIAEPFKTIDLDHPLPNKSYPELEPLLKRLDSQQYVMKKQNEKLEQNRREFNTVLDGMKEGVLLLGAKGQILSINHAASALLASGGDSMDKNILALTSDTDIQEVVTDALDGKQVEKEKPFGSRIYQITGSPVSDEGVVNGAAVLFVDVTEKEMQDQMRREFTANVAHELKTPLHTISGYAELLDSGLVREEDKQDFYDKIHFEAKRMSDLINDIMNLSHLDEGNQQVEWEVTDYYSEVSSAIKELEKQAEEKNVAVSFEGESILARTVPGLFHEIVHNLVDNAIKYNKPGGKVDVSIHAVDQKAILKVKDTGIGIPEKDRDRIFERFYRVSKSRSRDSGGTGLGLSIVKHAAQILEAEVRLESTLGEGTEWTVIFPTRHAKKAKK